MGSQYVDIAALANYFGVSRQTIRRWSKSDEFPSPLQIGAGSLRWHVSDIEKFEERPRWSNPDEA